MSRKPRTKKPVDTQKDRDESKKPGFKHENTPNKNDISWSNKNPQLVKDVASFPFGFPSGIRINTTNSVYTAQLSDKTVRDNVDNSGILRLEMVNCPGYADSEHDPVNIAATNIYSYVRHFNSGHANYDRQDMMMYMLAVANAWILHASAARAYGLMSAYNVYNRFAPEQLVNAAGWDFEDLNKNLAKFRGAINMYATRLNSLAVPDTMPIFKRWYKMYSGVYSDMNIRKAQLYLYAPKGVGFYDETVETGSMIKYHLLNVSNHKMTVDEFIELSNLITARLLGSEDIGIISGDIMKAYSASNCIRLDSLPDNYVVSPEFNDEILHQIMNTTITSTDTTVTGEGVTSYVDSLSTKQDPSLDHGIIKYKPVTNVSGIKIGNTQLKKSLNPYYGNKILNFFFDDPTPEHVMIATRHLTACDANGDLNVMGTTFCGGMRLFYKDYNDGFSSTYLSSSVVGEGAEYTAASGYNINSGYINGLWRTLVNLNHLHQFAYHPAMICINGINRPGATADTEPESMSYSYDIQLANYTVISPQALKQIHLADLLSEFDVPVNW